MINSEKAYLAAVMYLLLIAYFWSGYHVFSDEFDFFFITTRFFDDDFTRSITNGFCQSANGLDVPFSAYLPGSILSLLGQVQSWFALRWLGIFLFLLSIIPFVILIKTYPKELIFWILFIIPLIGIMPISLIMIRGEYLLTVIYFVFFLSIYRDKDPQAKLALPIFLFICYLCASYVHPKAFYLLPAVMLFIHTHTKVVIGLTLNSFLLWHLIDYAPFVIEVTQTCPEVPKREHILENMVISPLKLFSDPSGFFTEILASLKDVTFQSDRVLLSEQYEHAYVPSIKTSDIVNLMAVKTLNTFSVFGNVMSVLIIFCLLPVLLFDKTIRRSNRALLALITISVLSMFTLNKSRLFYDLSYSNYGFALIAAICVHLTYRNPKLYDSLSAVNKIRKIKHLQFFIGSAVAFIFLLNVVKVHDDIGSSLLNGWVGSGMSLTQEMVFEGEDAILGKCVNREVRLTDRFITDPIAYPIVKDSKNPLLINWLWFYMSEAGYASFSGKDGFHEYFLDKTMKYSREKGVAAIVTSCASFGSFSPIRLGGYRISAGNAPKTEICCVPIK